MTATRRSSFAGVLVFWMLCAGPLALAAADGVTTRVSLGSGGAQGNNGSGGDRAPIGGGGRFVAFSSQASNLVPGDTNAGGVGGEDVFVRDRFTGATTRVSVSSSGTEAIGASSSPAISADGRYVAFESSASNLVTGDTNGESDIFVHDRQAASTTRINLSSGGAQANGHSSDPSISADGRYVAFRSNAGNLVLGDTNATYDVFVHDRQTGTTVRASVATGGAEGNSSSDSPSLSADGNHVVFSSHASNLVAGDTNGATDVFVRDLAAVVTIRASVSSTGAESDGPSLVPSLSADGRLVAFHTLATNLVPGHTDLVDFLVRDRLAATTERVGTSTHGSNPGDPHIYQPGISSDGRFVVFDSDLPLVPGDTNSHFDVHVRDRQTGGITRVSLGPGGAQTNLSSFAPAISADGRFVSFGSRATNLVSGDTNSWPDTFLHDRDATAFTVMCDPGAGGTIDCPCSNPPSGPGRGCNNSSATGGASLSASGIAYLSADSLVFTTSGEKPTSLSIVLQGTTSTSSGLVYGQGVRCVSGALKRLYTKDATGGSITAPNFGAGELPVHQRSAALGDAIPAGGTRSYLVYYRDGNVLGGCPATATFNATQTGIVAWSP